MHWGKVLYFVGMTLLFASIVGQFIPIMASGLCYGGVLLGAGIAMVGSMLWEYTRPRNSNSG